MSRQPILLALALLTTHILVPFTALAQTPSVIHYNGYSGSSPTGEIFAINDDGIGLTRITADPAILNVPTKRSDYPGGRQFLKQPTVGTIPGTTTEYFDLMSWNQAGHTRQITAFNGPYYVTSVPMFIWSNDGLDTFCSFFLDDPATGMALLCRAHVTPGDIADPAFPPLVLGDPRLEVVAQWPSHFSYAWDRTGSRIFYLDTRVSEGTRLRVKTAGDGGTPDTDQVLFDQVGPYDVRPLALTISPLDDRIILKAQIYERQKGKTVLKTDGLYTRNPVTGTWDWLINNHTSGLMGFSAPPGFSPDGTGLAFSASRTVVSGRTSTKVYGIYKMSPSGSPPVRLTESSVGVGSGARWTW